MNNVKENVVAQDLLARGLVGPGLPTALKISLGSLKVEVFEPTDIVIVAKLSG